MPWELPQVNDNQGELAGSDSMDTEDTRESPVDDDKLGVREGTAMMEAMCQAEEARIQEENRTRQMSYAGMSA